MLRITEFLDSKYDVMLRGRLFWIKILIFQSHVTPRLRTFLSKITFFEEKRQ